MAIWIIGLSVSSRSQRRSSSWTFPADRPVRQEDRHYEEVSGVKQKGQRDQRAIYCGRETRRDNISSRWSTACGGDQTHLSRHRLDCSSSRVCGPAYYCDIAPRSAGEVHINPEYVLAGQDMALLQQQKGMLFVLIFLPECLITRARHTGVCPSVGPPRSLIIG